MIAGRNTNARMDAEAFDRGAAASRFHRADKSRSRETGGTGLGLAIVKAIIEGHGGTISATSAGKGQGSRFTIALPEKTSAA